LVAIIVIFRSVAPVILFLFFVLVRFLSQEDLGSSQMIRTV
jgi:hypothetical protein